MCCQKSRAEYLQCTHSKALFHCMQTIHLLRQDQFSKLKHLAHLSNIATDIDGIRA